MNPEHIAVTATVVTIIVQAIKPTGIPPSFLPVIGLLVGVGVGITLTVGTRTSVTRCSIVPSGRSRSWVADTPSGCRCHSIRGHSSRRGSN